jgi:hypothetical protein
LLRGATYCKDNRLLPRGWQGSHSDASATEPAGTADDSDFVGGADSVVYIVPAASAPLRVTAALHYQVIAPRFAAELFRVPTAEVRDFQRLYRSVSRLPETLATVERQVP